MSDPHVPLRRDIQLLGTLLGERLRASEGEALFDTVERVRALSKAAHGEGGDAAFGSHFGGDIFGCAMTGSEVEIGTQRCITIMGEFARCLSIPFVPSGHMVNEHQPRKWAGA